MTKLHEDIIVEGDKAKSAHKNIAGMFFANMNCEFVEKTC